MIKCAYFTFEGKRSGTSYHQAYIYQDIARTHGILFDYYPVLPDGLWNLWKKCLRTDGCLAGFMRKLFRNMVIPSWRLSQLAAAILRGNQCVMIGGCLLQPQSAPWLEMIFRKALKALGKPLVLYLADAMHVPFPKQYIIRYHAVDHIIAVTPWLMSQLKDMGLSCSIARIAIDTERYPQVIQRVRGNIVIGFSGGPNNFKDLLEIEDVIAEIINQYSEIRFVVVSCHPPLFKNKRLRYEFIPWMGDDPYNGPFELGVEEMLQFKIGLAPLLNSDYSRGKDSAKLRQYMALGLAVIGSDVGVNAEIIRHGDNGFLATTREDWLAGLKRLIDDPELRHRMGIAARRDVKKLFDVRVQAEALTNELKKYISFHNVKKGRMRL